MLIRFFRSSYLGQYLALLFLTAAIGLPHFFAYPDAPENIQAVPLYSFLSMWATEPSIWIPLLSLILLYVEALLLNQFLADHNLIPKNSLLGGFTYIILMSGMDGIYSLHPMLFVNMLLILLLNLSLHLYQSKNSFNNVFMAGFLIALIALLFNHGIYLLLLFASILILMRALNWREWLISIAGFAIPFVYAIAFYYLTDRLDLLRLIDWGYVRLAFTLPAYDIISWIHYALIIFILMITSGKVMSKLFVKNIDIRKKTTAVFYFFTVLFLIFLFSHSENKSIALIMLPVAVLISIYISQLKRLWFYQLIFLLLLLLDIYQNYAGIWIRELN